MKKTILSISKTVFISFVVSIMFGCTGSTNKKVGLLVHDVEGHWILDVKFIKQFAAEKGIELVMRDAKANENLQLTQANELIELGVDVLIVVAVNKNTAAGIVRKAQEENIEVIAYDRLISNTDLEYYITYEYAEIGKMQADYAISKCPKGNYVMFWGDPSDNNALSLRVGQEAAIKPLVDNGQINMIFRSYVEDWSRINATHRMKSILSFADAKIDAVIASNDKIALGVIDAFRELDIELPYVITGQDGVDEACNSIQQGLLTMSVYKSSEEMAQKAIDLCENLLKGNKNFEIDGYTNNRKTEVPTLYLKPKIIDKTNIEEHLQYKLKESSEHE